MIVLPMAGLSSRFFRAGYTVPKYMLDLHGRTVFAHALGSFAGLFDHERFLVICRGVYETPGFVRAECARLGLAEDRLELVTLEGETAGQAETVAAGLRRAGVPPETEIAIFNIDTFRPGFRWPAAFDRRAVDGYLEVFRGEGEHWSFVRPDPADPAGSRALEVTEKVRISDLCSDGLYHFREAGLFLSLYGEIEERDPATLQGGERYVAPLYNAAIRRGLDIRCSVVPTEAIRFCGTPTEYDALRARPPFPPVDPAPPPPADPALEAALAEAEGRMAAGEPVAALRRLADILEREPADPRPYRKAAQALIAAIERPETLAVWDAAEREAFRRRLILQRGCATRPYILPHALASLLTSDHAAATGLVAEFEPTLRAMLDEVEGAPPVPLVLLLATGRSRLGDRISQERISALHLSAFPRFEAEDLSLPYSVLFHAKAFGRNRDDLLDRWPDAAAAARAKPALTPLQRLLLAWLSGRPPLAPDEALGPTLERALAASDGSEREREGARSIAVRAWRRGALAPEIAARLGLGAELPDFADRVAAARGAAEAAADGEPAPPLDGRPRQVLRAATNLAGLHLPALTRGQRRVRVAVCVSGQLRGYRAALESWRRSLLAHVETRLFVHSWTRIGRAEAAPTRHVLPFEGAGFTAAWRRIALREGYQAMRARQPTLFRALDDATTTTEEELRAVYGATAVRLDDETDAAFAGWSNSRKMHHKIWAAHRLAEESGEGFDLIVRIRPDLPISLVTFDWREIRDACRATPRLYADHGYGVHYGGLMIGDQLAIGAREAMRIYASAAAFQPEAEAAGLARCRAGFVGHGTLAQTCWLHGLDVRPAPVKLGGLLDPAPLGAQEILAALETDAAGRDDAIDRELIAAARSDVR